MSWLFGIAGTELSEEQRIKLDHLLPPHQIKIDRPGLHIAGDGPHSTTFHLEDNNAGFLALGVGLKGDANTYSLLDLNAWKNETSNQTKLTDSLEGHFVVCKYDREKATFETDKLGLRDLYVASKNGQTFFSTRIDLLTQAIGNAMLDLRRLGSKWMLVNQMSEASIFKDVTRISRGEVATIRDGTIKIERHEWWPSEENVRTPENILASILAGIASSGKKIRLGLSGGLDSRVLCALLTKLPRDQWDTCTFGDPMHPDNLVAEQVAKACGIAHRSYYSPLPTDPAAALKTLEQFVMQTMLTHPASQAFSMQYNNNVADDGVIYLDGGLGELARGRYFNQLIYRGGRAIAVRDTQRMALLLRTSRPAIFSQEVNMEFEQGIEEDLNNALDTIPFTDTRNWANLLALKTRIPNAGGPEQTRIDSYLQSLMPLVQSSFVEASWHAARSDGDKFYSRIINESAHQLTKIELVKNHTTYPYGLPRLIAHVYYKIKTRLGYVYHDTVRDDYLTLMREVVRDYASSAIAVDIYDSEKVSTLVNRYYAGDKSLATSLDWWFTFEVFRRKLAAKEIVLDD